MKRVHLLYIVLLLSVLLGPLGAPAAGQEGPIRIVSEEIENNFPVELYFRIEVESQAAPISRVKLYYRLRGSESDTVVPLEIEPGQQVEASYRWYTEYQTIPPGAPILYHWEIRDRAGNELTTETQTFYYDDVRFPWQTRADEDVAVFWYEGDESFGETLFETASTSLRTLADHLGAELEFPLRVVVYGRSEDFRSAFPRMHDWVGGRAFSSMGLTVQIIAPGDRDYLLRVIPHEISHLLFYQLTDNPFVAPPTWLNEGMAVYNEWRDATYYDRVVTEAAREDRLLPIAFLTGSFPADRERAILAYAQSYSMVRMLIETYGWESMAAYLHAFKTAELHFDEEQAFEEAFGLPFDTFLELWREHVAGKPVPTRPPEWTPKKSFPTPEPDGEPGPTNPLLPAWPCLAPVLIVPLGAVFWCRRKERGGGGV